MKVKTQSLSSQYWSRKNLQVIEEEENERDRMQDSIEMESELTVLFGMEYTEFKQFHTLNIEKQTEKIELFRSVYNELEGVIDLNNYNLTGRGLIALLESIEDTSNLTHLYLSSNSLTVSFNSGLLYLQTLQQSRA
jgi:hypothetical protein